MALWENIRLTSACNVMVRTKDLFDKDGLNAGL